MRQSMSYTLMARLSHATDAARTCLPSDNRRHLYLFASIGIVWWLGNRVVLLAHATVAVDGWTNRKSHELVHTDGKFFQGNRV